MNIKTFAYGESVDSYATVSDALKTGRVVEVRKVSDDLFEVVEMCDEWAHVELSREQLIAWASELLAMAGEVRE